MEKSVFPHIHQVDSGTVDYFYRNYRPVFVLSTGRCGSRWIVETCRLGAKVSAWHEPRPALMHMASWPLVNRNLELQQALLRACRFELILEAFLEDRIYVESNQCLSFFLAALAGLFPGAVFLHLIRHPGHFCASAIRKGWYANDTIWEMGRLRPFRPGTWNERKTQLQKLGWYWTVVNNTLNRQLRALPAERCRVVSLERLANDLDFLVDTLAFCGIDGIAAAELERLQKTRINKLEAAQSEPANMKKRYDFPDYPDWSAADRLALRKACPTAARWGYAL